MEKIIFNEKTHQYFLDGRELISVTTLLRKHGLAQDYGNVDPAVLKAKAERGKQIHAELEAYAKNGEIGFSKELSYFIDYINKNGISIHKVEFIVHNDICAGTIDLVAISLEDGYLFIDHKTTAQRHKDAESWQLSLYVYLYERCTPEQLKKDRTKLRVLHYLEDGFETYDLPRIADAEIDKLMECERNGTLYKREIVGITASQLKEVEEIEEVIAYHENLLKESKRRYENMQQALMMAMKQNGVTSHDFGRIKITYTPPSTRTTIDTEKLLKEHPEINKVNYQKTSPVKEKLTITIRKEKDKNA